MARNPSMARTTRSARETIHRSVRRCSQPFGPRRGATKGLPIHGSRKSATQGRPVERFTSPATMWADTGAAVE
jgi:hypothetical protein